MNVGELLDAVFSLYRRNFLLIAGISAVVQVPYALLQFALLQFTGLGALLNRTSSLGGLSTAPGSAPPQTLTPDQLHQLQSLLGGVLLFDVVLLLVGTLLVLPLATAATARAVSDRYLDRDTSLAASYGTALRRLGPLIVQSLILFGGAILLLIGFALMVVLGALLGPAGVIVILAAIAGFFVVATLVYVRTSLAAPVIVLEGVSGWRGLVRSWHLVRGIFWRILGIRLLIGLIAAIISGIVVALLSLAGAGMDTTGRLITSQAASALATVFISPITYIAVTLLYYDTRIRKEGFDIEMLARSL